MCCGQTCHFLVAMDESLLGFAPHVLQRKGTASTLQASQLTITNMMVEGDPSARNGKPNNQARDRLTTRAKGRGIMTLRKTMNSKFHSLYRFGASAPHGRRRPPSRARGRGKESVHLLQWIPLPLGSLGASQKSSNKNK